MNVQFPKPLALLLACALVVGSFVLPTPRAYATSCANDQVLTGATTTMTFFVSGASCVGVITTTGASTFAPPSDWQNSANTIEVIGGGGNGLAGTTAAGGSGGGGGAYSSATNVTATSSTGLSVGAVAGDTWFGTVTTVDAGGGKTATTSTSIAPGGSVEAGSGFVGGNGGVGSSTAKTAGGGGGGAAGKNGKGGNGGGSGSTAGKGGGGGGGAGDATGAGSNGSGNSNSTTGSNGGNNGSATGLGLGATTTTCTASNNGRSGGGAGGGFALTGAGTAGAGCAATLDTEWTINSVAYGSGGGGGGGGSNSSGSTGTAGAGGAGSTYGAGGGGGGSAKTAGGALGAGQQGLIIITYTPIAITVPIVTTNSAQSFTPTSANVFGSITGGSNATQHGFAMSTNSTLSSGVSTTTDGAFSGTGSWNDATTTLSANTTYFYRAYAQNSAGFGYGTILSFSTGNNTPSRKMRLFEGFKIKLIGNKLKLLQQ